MTDRNVYEPMMVDDITGQMSNVFLQPDAFVASAKRKETHLRALLDARDINNPAEDPNALYQRTLLDVEKGNAEELLLDEVNTYAMNSTQAAMNFALENVSPDNPEAIQTARDVMQNADTMRAQFADIDGYQQMYLDANAPEGIASLNARREAVQAYAFGELEKLTEDDNLLDTLIDGVALLAPDFIKDTMDTFESGIFDAPGDFMKFSKDFQLRDPDEQAILMQAIVPKLYETFDGNGFKVAAAIHTLFDTVGSSQEIAIATGADIFSVAAEIPALIRTLRIAKSFAAQRTLSRRTVDSENIADTARKQAVAGLEDDAVREATGVTKMDAAHSANPAPTRMIDDAGGSIDDIAGEIDIVKNQQIKMLEEELLPVSGNKMNRGEFKQLLREKSLFIKRLNQLYYDKRTLSSSMKGGHKVAQARSARVAQINEDIVRTQDQLNIVESRINANAAPARAEADLSRLQQGIIPERFQSRVQRAIEDEKARIQSRREAAKVKMDEPITPVKTADQLSEEAKNNLGVVFPKAADEFGGQIDSLLDDMVQLEAFTADDQSKAIARVQDQIKQEINDAGQSLNDMSVVSRDQTGFTLRYSTTSGESERVVKFTRDDNGALLSENEAAEFKSRFRDLFDHVFSPQHYFESLDPNVVKDVTFAGQQVARLRNGLAKLWKESEAGLTKQERFEVDTWLLAGDEENRIWRIADLRGGAESQAGRARLNDSQIDSYYKKRAFFDKLHDIRDGLFRREIEIMGYRNAKYTDKAGNTKDVITRPRTNFDFGDAKTTDRVWLPDSDEFHSVEYVRANKQKFIDRGYQVGDLLEEFTTKSGNKVSLVLTKSEKVSDLPKKVLNYQAGYIPRIYQKGYWYARDMDAKNQPVLYAFKTREEGEKWAKATEGNIRVFADREYGKVAKMTEDANAYGGLYTGSRKQRPLMVKSGEDVYRPERMSVGEATERYVSNISSIIPMNEYRLNTMTRFENTVENLAQARGGQGFIGPKRFDSEIDLPQDIKRTMESYRDYVKDVMRIGGKEETRTEQILLGVANSMDGKSFLDKPRRFVLNHSDGSPTGWLKGHAFNLMLGWFNPRQLFVQAQNASLAISMNPTKAPGAIMDALKMRTIATLPEDKMLEAAKHLGYDDELIQSLRAYNRSGLRDSIVRQADFDVNAMGMNNGSLDAARKAAKAGRFFFNEGENFSRLISWNIARRKWLDSNPGKVIGDRATKFISDDALRMQMNLQSENAAWWQRAPGLNLMTQFLQVQAKFLENVMPKVMGGSSQWTKQEKAKAAIGQFLLYGTVGVPIAEEVIAYYAELTGDTPQGVMERNPEMTDAINEGFVGMMASVIGAEDLAPSESFNLMAGLDDNVIADMMKGFSSIFNGGFEEEGFVETFTGPSAVTIRRVGNVVDNLALSAKTLYHIPSGEVAYGLILSNLESVASMTSTWTNIEKLQMLHATGRLYSASGRLVATEQDVGEMSLMTQLGVAMGFPTDIEQAYYATKGSLRSDAMDKKKDTERLQQIQLEMIETGDINLGKAKQAAILLKYSEHKKMKMMEGVIERTFLPKSPVQKTLNAATRSYFESNGRTGISTAQGELANEVSK